MERPPRPDIREIVKSIDRRLRTMERHHHPIQTTLQVADEGTPLGLIDTIDFRGLNVQASGDRDGYAIVQMAGTAGTFDAIVDATLLDSDPISRLFRGIGEALTYLKDVVGLTDRALVLVRPGNYVETEDWTNATQVYLFGLNKQPYALVAQTSSVTWDHNNFNGQTSSWVIEGIEMGFGNTKLTGFVGTLSARHCIFNLGGAGGMAVAATGLHIVNDLGVYIDCGFLYMRRLATNRAFCDNVDVQIEGDSNAPSITIAGTAFFATGMRASSAGGSGSIETWALPSLTVIELAESQNRMNQGGTGAVLNLTASSPGILSISSKAGETYNLTVTGTPKKVFLEGTFSDVVVPSPDTVANGGKSHRLDITCDDLTVGGPASLDVRATSRVVISGNSVTGSINLYGDIGSGQTFLTFTNADYCTLLVSALESLGTGTGKPYAFDAASTNNFLIFPDTDAWPTAGTDAGTDNIVLPEDFPGGGTAGIAPAAADYLVGTAQAGLSAEIVVGATPGGELGGTWAAPTVDAVHSGSAHAAFAAGATDESRATGAGAYVLNSTTWADVDNTLDLVIAAAVGDWIEVGLSGLYGNQASVGMLDAVSVVAGAPVNSWADNAAPDNTHWGVTAWVGASGLAVTAGGSVVKEVVAGDISGGNVTIRLRYRTAAAVNKHLNASAVQPLHFWASNRKQP